MKKKRTRPLTSKQKQLYCYHVELILIGGLFHRFDVEQPSTSRCSKAVDSDPSNLFNTIAYSSFGKASICSSFSAKSGSSTTTTGNENLDSLLKTISKDPSIIMANMQESLNDVNSIRYAI